MLTQRVDVDGQKYLLLCCASPAGVFVQKEEAKPALVMPSINAKQCVVVMELGVALLLIGKVCPAVPSSICYFLLFSPHLPLSRPF